MTSIAQKFAPIGSDGSRKGLLNKYIQEKNRQVEKIFLQEQEFIHNNAFAPSKISTSRYGIIPHLISKPKPKPVVYSVNELATKVTTDQEIDAAGASDVIHDVNEISQAFAGMKGRYDMQELAIAEMRENIQIWADEVRKLESKVANNDTALQTRDEIFLMRLDLFTSAMEAVTTKLEDLGGEMAKIITRVDRLEAAVGIVDGEGAASTLSLAEYFFENGDRESDELDALIPLLVVTSPSAASRDSPAVEEHLGDVSCGKEKYYDIASAEEDEEDEDEEGEEGSNDESGEENFENEQ